MITDQMVEKAAVAIAAEFAKSLLPMVIQPDWQDWVDEARAALTAALGDAGWQDISTAPATCHVLACRFDECEWIYAVVSSPPTKPFTHWQMLPTPPVTRHGRGTTTDGTA